MKTRILAVVLALTMVMAGTAMANTLTDIVKRGELRVAVQSGAAPYAFVDKNGDHAGSMVDFARDMADRMGVKLTILDFDWDGLIPALLSGKAVAAIVPLEDLQRLEALDDERDYQAGVKVERESRKQGKQD